MNTKTTSITISAPKEKVYNYLSNIENLPKWATEFCQQLKVDGDNYKVVTPMGEMHFEIHGDKKTGVIDLFTGPSKEQMGIFPTRVVELDTKSSMFVCTLLQEPSMGEQEFQGQFESVKREMQNIKKILG